MKKLLFTSLILLGANAFAQQFPISANNMFSSPGQSYEQMEISTTPGMMQSAGFNWGIAIATDPSEIPSLLNAAAQHNVNLILEGPIPDYGWAERLYMERDPTYFSMVNGTHSSLSPDPNSDQPHSDPYYDLKPLEATLANAYMVEGATHDPVDPWVDGASYQVYFRLKAQSIDPPPTPVVKIEVYDETTQSMLASKVLYTVNFNASNTWQTFELTFTPPNQPYSPGGTPAVSENPNYYVAESQSTASQSTFPDNIDVRVWWYGEIEAWLDDIRIESTDGKTDFSTDSLFSGYYDSKVEADAQQYDSYAALGRYYLKDEPYISQYFSYAHLNGLMSQVSPDLAAGKGLGYTQKDEGDHSHPWYWVGDTYKRFLTEAKPYELAAEVNRFLKKDQQPYTTGYTSMAQNELQYEMWRFDSAEADCYLSSSGTWRAHINSSNWKGTTREPHLVEVSAQAWCALAQGANGIDYYQYLTDPGDSCIGLVDPNLNEINSSSQYEQGALGYSYDENKWNGIAALNQTIADTIAPVLTQLKWDAAYSMNEGQPTSGVIHSITTGDPSDSTYVELGLFNDASGNNYFMLVNTRTDSTQIRAVTVNFSLPSGNWAISDVSSHNTWIVASNGSFTDQIAAGEGKLYKVVPAAFGSTTFTGNVTVEAGGTMTVNPGATLTIGGGLSIVVNGDLNASGTSSQPITFTSSSGDWNGITFTNSSTGNLQDCTISYASSPVIIDTANVTINGCTINNSSFYGGNGNTAAAIQVWDANPTIENTAIDGESDSWNGVRFGNGSIGTMTGCTVQNLGEGNGIVIQGGSSPSILSSRITGNYYYGVIANTDGTGDPVIEGDYIDSNGIVGGSKYYQGILFINSTGHVNLDTVSNSNVGIYCYDYCTASSGQAGENIIIDNNYGIGAFDYSSPVFGHAIGNPPVTYDGTCNQIYNNATDNLYAVNNSSIEAEYNWWGAYPPSDGFYADGTSSLDYTNSLTSPNACPASGSPTIAANTAFTSTAATPVQMGMWDENAGHWKRAAAEYEGILKDTASIIEKRYALERLYNVFRASKDTTMISTFQTLADSASQLSSMAQEILTGVYLGAGRFSDAENLANELIAQHPGTEIAKDQLIILASLDQYNQSYGTLSSTALAELKSEVASTTDAGLIPALTMTATSSSSQASQSQQLTLGVDTARAVQLKFALGNYPNPFNPTTVIKYEIPKETHVTITVFDILGRKVETLVNGNETAGIHEVTFDGSRFASGVYFYRLTTQSYSKVMKMLMLK